jgi:lipopolysaccharide transport system ATP-binding protein
MTVIQLSNICKSYLIYGSPVQALAAMVAPQRVAAQTIWALKEINLEVKQGECLGIIGRNGSGKSTLLKVIGGIITPTGGLRKIQGQVSMLLDLSVGMQGTLSGQANIRNLGSILGLPGEEIDRRMATIIEFAELGEAIHRPVKTYSTGMMLRLGFSIALHVDFDILLVDEVLSVGDVTFQRKCVHRLRELYQQQGRTIVIVSHALNDLCALTDRLVLVEEGQILRDGPTEEVVGAYWQECERQQNRLGQRVQPLKVQNPYGPDSGKIRLEAVRFLNAEGLEQEEFFTGQALSFEIWFFAAEPVEDPLFRVQIFRNDGLWVHGMNNHRHNLRLGQVCGRGCLRLEYAQLVLLEGDYYVTVGIWPDEFKSFLSDVAYDVHEMRYTLRLRSERSQGGGIVAQLASWKFFGPGTPELQALLMAQQGSTDAAPSGSSMTGVKEEAQ